MFFAHFVAREYEVSYSDDNADLVVHPIHDPFREIRERTLWIHCLDCSFQKVSPFGLNVDQANEIRNNWLQVVTQHFAFFSIFAMVLDLPITFLLLR